MPCILCGKRLANLSSLRRHVSRIHSMNSNTRFQCKICKRTFGRRDLYERHLKEKHPFYRIEPEVFTDEVRNEATIPDKWKRPLETLTKQQLEKAKFRVVPAKERNPPGPHTQKPAQTEDKIPIDLLKGDLLLSDSSSDNSSVKSISSTELPGPLVVYKKLAYASTSDATICLDELAYP
ncbi:histone-lysine N-methyltransferase PRDM16-like [Ylistrum balloti]|uniref:histone-lysine N-methyltransferase PRDM16-like n=1 Tax=Ylistrum balloti TaxID=509963 RepID=UPI002905D904|nr:histone-lysine N-methyltransferase PRDM16-like [Ylistrum balloti]